MEQLVEQLKSNQSEVGPFLIVAPIQSAECAEQFFAWISHQDLGQIHLILVHIAADLCAQTLPVSALTASRVIAKREDEAMQVIVAVERLKKRIADHLPDSIVECRILNGEFAKNIIRVIEENKAHKLVLTKNERNFPTTKVACSVEFISR